MSAGLGMGVWVRLSVSVAVCERRVSTCLTWTRGRVQAHRGAPVAADPLIVPSDVRHPSVPAAMRGPPAMTNRALLWRRPSPSPMPACPQMVLGACREGVLSMLGGGRCAVELYSLQEQLLGGWRSEFGGMRVAVEGAGKGRVGG